ncbi:MAG: Crp/Fnr family transcriptional regulator [Pyrinomonadaceae bacterium]|nr:Crp/Fnr family transcriptional regulator [Pyrinomonadaceae bacterium]
MPLSKNHSVVRANRLLATLPRKEYQRLLPSMEEIPLLFEKIEPGEPILDVYFPTSGIVSLLAAVEDRATLEVGLVGREGMVGLPVFMEVKTSRNLAVVQGAGSALRMKANIFAKECQDGGSLPRLLRRYSHSLLTQISQTAVCNRFHPIDARLARWLLMTRDRMGSDEFQLTQEFLSNMLGVRREGVNKAAGMLQQKQLINYSRGTLTILNGTGLEAIACNCYGIIREEYDALLPEKARVKTLH